MKLIKALTIWLTLLASMLLVGCASVPMGDASQDAATVLRQCTVELRQASAP